MRWRLLKHGASDAATNMATDECLFESAVSGEAPATVRLYLWRRPTLSVGYRQKWEEVCDLAACARWSVDLVRRVTGGRAVLHDRELTYAVAAPASVWLGGSSVHAVYAWVRGAIREALQNENVRLDPDGSAGRLGRAPSELPCFAVPSGHEISAGGRKLVASAQKWHRRGFLQHGSILLEVNETLWRRIATRGTRSSLAAVGLHELGWGSTVDRLTEVVARGFERCFGRPPAEDGLTPRECARVDELLRTKYASEAWVRLCPARGDA